MRLAAPLALLLALAACSDDKFPVEQLQDPGTCMKCHPQHYTQWSGSMHAYASDDPIFLAMHRRGQRDTKGALGDFCINCHAPMAKQLGFTDFTAFDPEALPPAARGITCYFCHNVEQVTATHDNGLAVANDQTMRGGVGGPVGTPAHHSKYDPVMDSTHNQSEMCGSCHDIIVPGTLNGTRDVALERTFSEWHGTFFSSTDNSNLHLTCGACHMATARLEPIADAPGVKARPNAFHDHTMAAIDTALTPFPETEAQLAELHEILDPSIRIVGPAPLAGTQPGGICVTPMDGGVITVRIDSLGTGHSWPSGASHDRRTWLELTAYDATGAVLFQSGVVPPGMDPEVVEPGVFGFFDRALKSDNTPAHFFWEVDHIDSHLLLAPAMPKMDVSQTARFPIGASWTNVDRVTARFRINPLPYAMVDDLIASKDLDPAIRDRLKTIEVSAPTVWRKATADAGKCGPPN